MADQPAAPDREPRRRRVPRDREPADQEGAGSGRPERGRAARREESADRGSRPARHTAPRRIGAAEAAEAAVQQISTLTGKSPEGVTGVQPADDGWLVAVEILEDRRVPSSADMMACYEVELGQDGSLQAYRRARRYSRGRADGDRESGR